MALSTPTVFSVHTIPKGTVSAQSQEACTVSSKQSRNESAKWLGEQCIWPYMKWVEIGVI